MSSQTDPPSSASNALNLDEFPSHSYDDWKTAAEKLLKGAPFEKRLVAHTYEGFELQPIYRKEDLKPLTHLGPLPGEGNNHRGNHFRTYKTHPWNIAQASEWPEPADFNKHIQAEIKSGLTEIICPIDGNQGLHLRTIEDFHIAFDNIDLTEVSLTIETLEDALPISALFIPYLNAQSIDFRKVAGCITNDPLGTLASSGELSISLDSALAEMALLTNFSIHETSPIKTISVSGRPYADGGSSTSQELGYALATGLYYLRKMQEAGIDVSECASRIRFSFSVGPHFFMEIAKFRAVRVLWSRIVAAMGGDSTAQKMTIHTQTGSTNKTVYDPHVNILRTCTEALSAILGGCDSLTITPFDKTACTSTELSRRISRNMHTILAEECSLNRVIDPGGGSYYLEHLTDELAKKSWTVFQSVERTGGMLQALKEGIPQAEIRNQVETKRKNVATLRTTLIGTNLYPNPDEVIKKPTKTSGSTLKTNSITEECPDLNLHRQLENLPIKDSRVLELCIQAATSGANLDQVRTALRLYNSDKVEVERIPHFRLTQDYEALRQASEAFAKETGVPPQLFQINLGPSRRYRMRADWTSSFFQVGGIQVINNQDFPDIEAVIKAVSKNHPTMSIIVSDDSTYEEQAAALARAVKKAAPDTHLLLAGAPGDNEEVLREAGIDGFIHLQLNNYETLKSILKQLGALP